MKKVIFSLVATAGVLFTMLTSCYNDSSIRQDINNLYDIVRELQDKVNQANNNVAALQDIVQVLEGRLYITSVTETADGWIFALSDGRTPHINHGVSPVIGVRQDADGIYYWTLNGGWLLDDDGNKLRVTGEDGAPGEPGAPGENAIAPQLTIEEGYWYLSTDGGETWTQLYKATGEDGAPGDSMFQDVSSDDCYWYFVLTGGETIRIPRGLWGARSITAVPYYSDGALAAADGEFTLTFDVLPAESAAKLAALDNALFCLKVVYTVPVKSELSAKLPVLSKEAVDGTLLLTVDGSLLSESFFDGTTGASACLSVVDGDNVLSSGYFPLKYIDPYNGYSYVDLGLSVKWATCNVGANTPEEYGDYFAWGETEPYYEGNAQSDDLVWKPGKEMGYSMGWTSYKWYTDDDGFTKYNSDGSFGIVDNKTVLEAEDDAAYVNWGSPWRMPTSEEIKELVNNSSWEWTADYNGSGVAGMVVTSTVPGYTDRLIFFPGTGTFAETALWLGASSVLLSSTYAYEYNIYGLYVTPDGMTLNSSVFRCFGFSVRPVAE